MDDHTRYGVVYLRKICSAGSVVIYQRLGKFLVAFSAISDALNSCPFIPEVNVFSVSKEHSAGWLKYYPKQ